MHVRVKPEALAARLRQRGGSRKRRSRSGWRAGQAFDVPAGCKLVEIDNSGALDDSAASFARLIGVGHD